MKIYAESVTNAVRNYARNMHIVTSKKVAEDLGFTQNQVSHALGLLKGQGFIKNIKFGVYEWVNNEAHIAAPSTVQDKVWRVLKINPVFTSQDIASQAGVGLTYAARKVREYRNAGLVEQQGWKRSFSNAPIRIWRLTTKGKKNIDRPALAVFEADPLVEKMVNLNKLVCTGMALRRDVDRKTAVSLCDEIKSKLIESGAGDEKEYEHE